MIGGGENGTIECHLAVFSEDEAFDHHFVATHSPPPCRSVSGISCASKTYLKWQGILLAIHSIVGG